ncbi:hypothetical protein AB0I16_33345 [Streptomyces sp. NPDC050703]|uniref:hypothetical protein n=1 Tax=Streptomyces sp. NPDC050703 TaxID=3157218 RepID=UPI00343AFBF5
MRNKLILPVSCLASAAAAFGLGVLVISGPNTPVAAAPQPQPTVPVPAPPLVVTAPPQAPVYGVTKVEPSQRTETPAAGSRGPLTDAQGDGKVLDDIVKTVKPRGIGVHVPDELLPFPAEDQKTLPPGVVPADPDAAYPDPDEGTDTSDDVVSGTPGETTNDDAQDTPPIDAPRPGPRPGGVTPALPPGVVPAS